jgi:hypothetical protein
LGAGLTREVQRLDPDLPLLLNSGYSHVLARAGDHSFGLLWRLYSVEALSRVLRKPAFSGRRK